MCKLYLNKVLLKIVTRKIYTAYTLHITKGGLDFIDKKVSELEDIAGKTT